MCRAKMSRSSPLAVLRCLGRIILGPLWTGRWAGLQLLNGEPIWTASKLPFVMLPANAAGLEGGKSGGMQFGRHAFSCNHPLFEAKGRALTTVRGLLRIAFRTDGSRSRTTKVLNG